MEIFSSNKETKRCSSHILIVLVTALIMLFTFPSFTIQTALAVDVALQWDANTEHDIAGYKVHYGIQSRNYTTTLNVGSFTSCVIGDLEPGQNYYFAATAYDIYGAESDYSTEVVYNGSSTNQPPVADAGSMQTVTEGTIVVLSGVNSYDLDDGIASYEWNLISGPYVEISATAESEVFFTAPEVGSEGSSLTFVLTVTDYSGQASTSTCIVNITTLNEAPAVDSTADQPVVGESSTETDDGGLKSTDNPVVNIELINNAPVAEAGTDQTAIEGNTVMLNASGSYDYDGRIVSYLWTQVGGAAVTLSNPMGINPIFTAPVVNWKGSLLTFVLTITDDGGLQSTDACSIVIEDSRTESDSASLPYGLKKKL